MNLEKKYAYEVYPKRDVEIVRGLGALLWDADGNEYIDCAAGIGVANIGHANPDVATAIHKQAQHVNFMRALKLPVLNYFHPRRHILISTKTDIIDASSTVGMNTTPPLLVSR